MFATVYVHTAPGMSELYEGAVPVRFNAEPDRDLVEQAVERAFDKLNQSFYDRARSDWVIDSVEIAH